MVLILTNNKPFSLANSVFGALIDFFGFGILYVTSVISFLGCCLVFYFYAKSDHTTAAISLEEIAASETENSEEEETFTDEDTQTINEKLSFFSLITTLYNQPRRLLNISYVIALFMLYIGMSVVENLIFLYFEFLGGSNTLCGITVAITVLFELPIFHYAPFILKWTKSPVWMFQAGCIAYVVRVVGYSIIPESHAPWVLILEPLHGVTIGFVLTGSVAFVDSLMPKGCESSGQGFLSSVTGLGQFFGLCIGGVLEGRVLYRVLAGIVSFGSLILHIGNYFSINLATEESNSSNGFQLKRMEANVVKRKCSDIVVDRPSYTKVAEPEVLGSKNHAFDIT